MEMRIYLPLLLVLILPAAQAQEANLSCPVKPAMEDCVNCGLEGHPSLSSIGSHKATQRLDSLVAAFDSEEMGLLPPAKIPADFSEIRVNDSHRFQTMEGFGASLTESSVLNINSLPPAKKKEVLEKLFSKEKGFGLNFLRLPIGSTDFSDQSKGNTTYNDLPEGETDPEMKHFDVSRDEKTFALLKEIVQINPKMKFLLTPWSPPAWMKENGNLIGRNVPGNNRLKKEAYDAFANYLTRSVEEYEKRGFKIYSLAMQNEPGYGEAPYPSMGMSAAEQAEVLGRFLGPKMRKKFPDVKLLALDHNWDMEKDVDEIVTNTEARPYVDGIAYHCYGGKVQAVGNTAKKYPEVPVFQTECTGTNSWWDGDLHWWLDNQVIGAGHMGAVSALAWNVALDEKNGPMNNGCDVCRGLITINGATKEISYNPELRALGLAAKFLNEGARRVESKTSDPDLAQIAYVNTDGSIVAVIHNSGDKEKNLRLVDQNCRDVFLKIPAKKAVSFRW